MAMNLDNYVDVPSRLRLALGDHPQLRVQELPAELLAWPGGDILLCTVKVWRDPDDPYPAIATATEPYPGRTSFTKGSELMNGMTSALGRALGYMGYGIQHSIASRDEVETAPARSQDRPMPDRPRDPDRVTMGSSSDAPTAAQLGKLKALGYSGPAPTTKVNASRLIDSIARADGESRD